MQILSVELNEFWQTYTCVIVIQTKMLNISIIFMLLSNQLLPTLASGSHCSYVHHQRSFLSILEPYINEELHYLLFCIWFFSLNMWLRFIYIILIIRRLLFCSGEQYSLPEYKFGYLFSCWWTLSCSQFLNDSIKLL